MATVTQTPTANPTEAPLAPPPLQNGDRLSADEFERRYSAMPYLKKAELINGVVYMPSPVAFADHGAPHFDLIFWLGSYRALTPGVLGGDNATLRLPLANRPQPDACLIVDPARGGRVRIEDRYIVGGPELVAEVAATNVNYDLHDKLDIYRRNGVQEYIVWRVFDHDIDWFVLRDEQYERSPLSAEGYFKSAFLPGLWLDPAALIRGDLVRVSQVAQQGAESPEHGAFVAQLQERAAQARC